MIYKALHFPDFDQYLSNILILYLIKFRVTQKVIKCKDMNFANILNILRVQQIYSEDAKNQTPFFTITSS